MVLSLSPLLRQCLEVVIVGAVGKLRLQKASWQRERIDRAVVFGTAGTLYTHSIVLISHQTEDRALKFLLEVLLVECAGLHAGFVCDGSHARL